MGAVAGGPGAPGVEGPGQAAQQHRHVGALGAVVGVELVEHEVLERVGRGLPEVLVAAAQQQLVEHLVVGEQDVGRVVADDPPVADEPAVGDPRARARGVVAGVEAGPDPAQGGLGGDEAGEPAGLVVGEGVHRVEDEGLHAGDAGGVGADHVVEDGDEEGLGLARAGAGDDEGGLRAAGARRVEPLERGGLVGVGLEAGGHPGQRVLGARWGRREGHARAQVGALEDAVGGVGEEGAQAGLGVVVGQREGGDEEVGQCTAQVVGDQWRAEFGHGSVLIAVGSPAIAVGLQVEEQVVRVKTFDEIAVVGRKLGAEVVVVDPLDKVSVRPEGAVSQAVAKSKVTVMRRCRPPITVVPQMALSALWRMKPEK